MNNETKPVSKKWANYYIPVEAYTDMFSRGLSIIVSKVMWDYILHLDLFKDERTSGQLRCSERLENQEDLINKTSHFKI